MIKLSETMPWQAKTLFYLFGITGALIAIGGVVMLPLVTIQTTFGNGIEIATIWLAGSAPLLYTAYGLKNRKRWALYASVVLVAIIMRVFFFPPLILFLFYCLWATYQKNKK